MAVTAKKKGIAPVKVVKAKKSTRFTTPHTRNHRFQPFSDRIAKLKIDPIRRKRYAEQSEELADETDSYFSRSLEEWRDLNLSQTFTEFAKEVAPLCDNLPMVLYNESKIMDIIIRYIEKGDALAMEPLLSLLSHFAHDLDVRFEPHFPRAVASVTCIAAKHDDPAVIEWSFTCLAWLFKYLSRLLVRNLCPLYDLMAPYLGQEAQKPFVVRFAAESLSFLLRKAAALYERDPVPLDKIISHMLCHDADARESTKGSLYEQGVMTLLTEGIKGIQGSAHSTGSAIIRSLLNVATSVANEHKATARNVVVGTITSIIHHTNKETFAPVLDTTVAFLRAQINDDESDMHLLTMVLMTVISVRKGSRISSWDTVAVLVHDLVKRLSAYEKLPSTWPYALGLLAVTLQTAAINAVLPLISLIEVVRTRSTTEEFMHFCDISARLGCERFKMFVLPQLEAFISQSWELHLDELCIFIPRLAARGIDIKIKLDSTRRAAFGDLLTERLQNDHHSANAMLTATRYINLDDSNRQFLSAALLNIVQSALSSTLQERSHSNDFAVGVCLKHYLDLSGEGDETTSALWAPLCAASSHFTTLPTFWHSILRVMTRCSSPTIDDAEALTISEAMISSLSLDSHAIREASLDALAKLYQIRGVDVPEVLATSITLESMPVNLDTSRSISMNLRRMTAAYLRDTSDKLMQVLGPTYCFGLLYVKLAQAREDSMTALAEMATSTNGEDTITQLAQKWLNGSKDSHDGSVQLDAPFDLEVGYFHAPSDFECTNLARIEAIYHQVFDESSSGYSTLHQMLSQNLERIPELGQEAREHALKVLDKMPHVAEKRSRMLVPVLLNWAGRMENVAETEDGSTSRWTRKEQKLMLTVFSKFTNPRVLYKSQEVHHALLSLAANGDVEIQKAALKALLAWKEPEVVRYQEHLNNLLDEDRFREEISVFLQDNTDDEMRAEDVPKLMPVLLRLLYGRAISGGKVGQGNRRKAIFIALSRFGPDVTATFLEIAMDKVCRFPTSAATTIIDDIQITAPVRQQLGMINMLDDMLQVLGSELGRHVLRLAHAITACAVAASRKIESSPSIDDLQDATMLRSIRQTAVQCLVKIFSSMDDQADLLPVATVVRKELVDARLDKFDTENTESVSGLLRLFSAWSASPRAADYFDGDRILIAISTLLDNSRTKEEVRLFILKEVIENLVESHATESFVQSAAPLFVRSTGRMLSHAPTKEVLDACVTSLTGLAGMIRDEQEAQNVIAVCAGLLTQPNRSVAPSTKFGLLRTISPLLERFGATGNEPLYAALCGLFSRLQDANSRTLVAKALSFLSMHDTQLSRAASICLDLNAQSDRLNEPDHDSRARGYSLILAEGKSLTVKEWTPIIHNCMFYIRDADDMVNRSSASQTLLRFLEIASAQPQAFSPTIAEVVIPGIEFGMRDSSELVRAEYLQLLGRLASNNPPWPGLADLAVLTVAGDEEASVFNNILHIQQHRRLRALRRLAEDAPHLSSNNVTKLLFPLLEHFVFDQAAGDSGRTLADQTVITIGALASCLNWASFRAIFRRYTGYMTSKEDLEKTVLRLLGVLVDALASKMKDPERLDSSSNDSRHANVILNDFLPPLLGYLQRKDESTVDRRMPVSVTIVKLLQLLPEEQMSQRLTPVLTNVCQVLRSRSQEARDQTRRALASILALIGPAYLKFMVKELRSALQRGYQLHVLSYTIHSLLIQVLEIGQAEDLDGCLAELMNVVMDDIFGVTGQEKDAEEYKSGMKEVKSSKSFDTMQLLARVTPIPSLGHLVRPLRSLLGEKLDTRTMQKADELLTRLRKGIDQNPAADSRDMLSFCHELVRQVYSDLNAPIKQDVIPDYKIRKYLIQMDSAKKSKVKGGASSQLSKLTAFGLNLMRNVVRRHPDLQTASNMAGFLPMIGDALIDEHEEIKLAGLRTLATIIRVPLPEIEDNALVYVKEAVMLVKAATNVRTESSKAALEFITAVLREKRTVNVRDADMAILLKAIKPDLDEPDRQSMIYKFLRAALGRKFLSAEIYEIMDEVGKTMVTNADRSIRESARSAYVQFVMDYPQGKDRWNKQTAFLVENLKYEHASGRQSVMEVLHQLLGKLGDDVFAQVAFTFFVALVPVRLSDSQQACRQMAGLLLGKLFERAEPELVRNLTSLLDKWLGQSDKPMIQCASLQCWTIFLRTGRTDKRQQERLRDQIVAMLVDEDVQVGPALLPALLETVSTMTEVCPETAFAASSMEIWRAVEQCMLVATDGIQSTASTLLSTYCNHLASSSTLLSGGLTSLPLRGSGGLELDADAMRRICTISMSALKAGNDETDDEVVTASSRILVFLGRCFAANELIWQENDVDDEADVGDDDDATPHRSSALEYLFNRLSYLIRQDAIPVKIRVAAVLCQGALINSLGSVPSLSSVVRSLYLLTDPAIPQATTDAHRGLQDKARDLLEVIQKTAGAEVYLAALNEARKDITAKREERRQKRKITAVAAPEKWAKDKKHKHELQKMKRKQKGIEARGHRRGW